MVILIQCIHGISNYNMYTFWLGTNIIACNASSLFTAILLMNSIMFCKWCPNQKQLSHWYFLCHWHNLGKSNEPQMNWNWTELLDLKHLSWYDCQHHHNLHWLSCFWIYLPLLLNLDLLTQAQFVDQLAFQTQINQPCRSKILQSCTCKFSQNSMIFTGFQAIYAVN